MNVTYPSVAATVLGLLRATMASSQAMPHLPPAVWQPVVGSGAAYAVDLKGLGKMEMEVVVTGTEMVGGKTGYWVELISRDPRVKGEGRTRMLYVGDRNSLDVKKMVTQLGTGPLTEVPLEGTESEHKDAFEFLGTEQITTPAGTFVCQHYRTKSGTAAPMRPEPADSEAAESESGPPPANVRAVEDYWLSDRVRPFGLVKLASKDGTQMLVRLITNAQPRR